MKTVTFNKDVLGHYNMVPDIKDEWLAALRSGEYKQGRERLKDGSNSYCCLGVLCVIHGRHQDTFVDFVDGGEHGWFYPVNVTAEPTISYVLPHESVYEWAGIHPGNDKTLTAGIEKEDGELIKIYTGHPASLLPSLNDTFKFSFEEIANYIEKYL